MCRLKSSLSSRKAVIPGWNRHESKIQGLSGLSEKRPHHLQEVQRWRSVRGGRRRMFLADDALMCRFRTRLGEPCLKTYPVECKDLMKRARTAFRAGRTLAESFRLAQLDAVVQMLEEHQCDFVDALGRDLHKVRRARGGPTASSPDVSLFCSSRALRPSCRS